MLQDTVPIVSITSEQRLESLKDEHAGENQFPSFGQVSPRRAWSIFVGPLLLIIDPIQK